MDELILSELEQTCDACPSQWEGKLSSGHYVYVRYRWGTLRMSISESGSFSSPLDEHRYWDVGDALDGILSTTDMLKITGLRYADVY